jgi:xylulokinase
MLLGIDLGTSELKALLLDEQHRIVAVAGERLALQRPRSLWSEQQPADWWAAMDLALQHLAAEQPAAMAGAVLLDAAGERR